MAILVCRVAWMPAYQSDAESPEGKYAASIRGGVPHESLNFLPVGDTYYGFVQNRGQQIDINKLGAENEDDAIPGVSVVFCAEDPKIGEFLVTGWYSNATVYREPIGRPEQDPLNRDVYFTAPEATLIGKAERCFGIPRARGRHRPPYGGVGERDIWYGLNAVPADTAQERTARERFRLSLLEYMASPSLGRPTPAHAVDESRKRRLSERLERKGTCRHFIREKGYQCEACQWEIEDEEVAVWGSSFELHHLKPFAELEEGALRVVGIDDFAVLCASCHRAIHRTDYVDNVAAFAHAYL